MEMGDTLAAIDPAVVHQTESFIRDAELKGKSVDHGLDMANDGIPGRNRQDGVIVLLGDDDDMDRCLGVDILERKDKIILINLLRRDLSRHDFTKNTILGHTSHLSQTVLPVM